MNPKLKQLFSTDPEVMALLQQKDIELKQKDTNELLLAIATRPVKDLAREMMKGDKGDKGEPGETPVKGRDYLTPEEVEQWTEIMTPKKGVDYIDGKDGEAPTRKELVSLIKPLIPEAIPGKDGKDGADLLMTDPQKIADALNTLKDVLEPSLIKGYLTIDSIIKEIKKGKLLELKDIKGARLDMNDQRWHGGGPTLVAGTGITITDNSNGTKTLTASGGLNSETPTGTVDGSNLTFTATHTPVFLITDGLIRVETVDYTLAGLVITMNATIPPCSFIRSLYN